MELFYHYKFIIVNFNKNIFIYNNYKNKKCECTIASVPLVIKNKIKRCAEKNNYTL